MVKITFKEIGCEQYKVLVDGEDIGWFSENIQFEGKIINPEVIAK